MRVSKRLAAAIFLLLASGSILRAQSSRTPIHVLHAVRIPGKIIVDGSLDDQSWMNARAEWGFTQRDPTEGVEPSQRTEVLIGYDDVSIYVGVRLFDTEPQKIVQQLSRRDDYADADRFTLQLSPNRDRLTGVQFEVSAAGVQRDAIISNDAFMDYSWDGVWQSAVRIDDEGWSLEMRIPFSQLRFPRGRRQIWGVNAARYIQRNNETDWMIWKGLTASTIAAIWN
jgi:hypothetical protein